MLKNNFISNIAYHKGSEVCDFRGDLVRQIQETVLPGEMPIEPVHPIQQPAFAHGMRAVAAPPGAGQFAFK